MTGSAAGLPPPHPRTRLHFLRGGRRRLASAQLTSPLTPADLLIARGATCFVILNLYPYNNGHLMVVPNRHVGSLAGRDRR